MRAEVSLSRAMGVTFLLLIAKPSRADVPLPGSFAWERGPGAESCLSEPELRTKIVALLGRDPFIEPGGPAVQGTILPSPDGFVASVRLHESGSSVETTREFRTSAADCAPLTDAVALALALALSPEPEPPRTEPSSNPNPPPVPEKKTIAPIEAADVGAWALLVEVPWSMGALPRPSTGIGFEVRRGLGRSFALALGGDWLPPASEGGQFSVSLARARLGACFVPLNGAFVVLGCGSAAAGDLHVKNEAATLDSAGDHGWFGVEANGRAGARLGSRWLVEAGAGVVVPMGRRIFETPPCPVIGFQQPPVILTVFISTGVLF